MDSPPVPSDLDLATVLKTKRQDLIERWSGASRRENTADHIPQAELIDHIPRFIDELILALHPGALPLPSLGENALEHGAQRMHLGFNVAEVVREYGTLHRSIVEIAAESGVPITSRDHIILARWLAGGLANAVSQYVNDRDAELHRQASEHLGFIAHEIRNPLSSIRMAFRLLQKGPLAEGGRSVEVLDRNLRRTMEVIDNSLYHASLSMGLAPRLETVPLLPFLEEQKLDCDAEARAKEIEVVVTAPADLVIEADVRLLHSALSNLLHNALKFSQPRTTTHLRARREEGRILIEVEDACGGLPPGKVEDLFKPLVQRGTDQTGFGLGLAIAQQAIQANSGTLRVRDAPGHGCVFTLDLPATTPGP
jgi:signal transduction histidine kinase